MANPTVVGVITSTSEASNATSHTFTLPTGIQNGDCLVFGVSLASTATVVANGAGMVNATGFVNTRSGHAHHTFIVRGLAAAQSGATVTITTGSALKIGVTGGVLRGVALTGSLDTPVGVNGGSATSFAGPAYVPAAGKVVIALVGVSSGSTAPPTTYTPPAGLTVAMTKASAGTTGRTGSAFAVDLAPNTAIGTAWTVDLAGSWSVTLVALPVAVAAPALSLLCTMGSFVKTLPANADTLFGGGSFSVSSAKTLGGVLVPPNDSRFRLRGAGGWAFGSGTEVGMYRPASRYPGTYGYPRSAQVDFRFTGQRFEVYFEHQGSSALMRVLVNGRRLTTLVQATGAGVPGNLFWYKVDLGQVVTDAIVTVEMDGVPWGGIVPDVGATIGAALPVLTERTIVLGDSTSDGSSQNTGANSGTWVLRVAKYLGWDDTWNQAIGGTGFVEPGTAVNFVDRAADITAWAPTRVIIWGGGNDGNTSIETPARALIDTVKAARPGVPIYVIGTWGPTSPASTARANRDAELELVAVAKGCYFISSITGRIRNNRGLLITTKAPMIASAADQTAYIGTDNVHPTDAGHQHIAEWLYEAFTAATEYPMALSVWNGAAEVAAALTLT